MIQILDALTGRARQRQATNDEVLVNAARRAANNESVDVDAVDAALVATGRTPEAFAELVELAGKRRRWHADMDRGPAAKAAAAKATATLQSEEARFVAVRDAWHQRAGQLQQEANAATALADRARDARNALVHPDSVPVPALADRLRAAHEAMGTATNRVAAATRAQSEQQARIKQATGQLELMAKEHGRELGPVPARDMPRAEEHTLTITRAKRRLAEADAELAEAHKALAAATAELAAAEDAALKL